MQMNLTDIMVLSEKSQTHRAMLSLITSIAFITHHDQSKLVEGLLGA